MSTVYAQIRKHLNNSCLRSICPAIFHTQILGSESGLRGTKFRVLAILRVLFFFSCWRPSLTHFRNPVARLSGLLPILA